MIKSKKISAFSLVETLVTLAAFGILMAMVSDVLILNLKVSRKITARTIVREDLAEMTGLMQRDMRNADYVNLDSCGKDVDLDGNGLDDIGCEVIHFEEIKWVNNSNINCPPGEFNGEAVGSICRLGSDNSILYQTSNYISIQSFLIDSTIQPGDPVTGAFASAIVYFTVYANASNPNWDINNQIRQVVVTTRNY